MFDAQYEAVLADTRESRAIHYNLRFMVFCEETGFEDPEAYPDAEEKDIFDKRAVHFLVRSKVTKQWVGAMRYVTAKHGELPVRSICDKLDTQMVANIDPGQVGEISRLCMPEMFRRQGLHKGQSVPEIFLGLLRAILVWAPEHDQRYCYFLASPALARVVNRLGLNLMKAGERCEHRGARVPYFADMWESRTLLQESATHTIREMFTRPGDPYTLYSQIVDDQPVAIAAGQ